MKTERFKALSLQLLNEAIKTWYDNEENKNFEPHIHIQVYKKLSREKYHEIKRNRHYEMMVKYLMDHNIDANKLNNLKNRRQRNDNNGKMTSNNQLSDGINTREIRRRRTTIKTNQTIIMHIMLIIIKIPVYILEDEVFSAVPALAAGYG